MMDDRFRDLETRFHIQMSGMAPHQKGGFGGSIILLFETER